MCNWIFSIIAEDVGDCFAEIALSKEWFCVVKVIHLCVFVIHVRR
jgi:hypothetical protein